jgi:hypothetical protein
VQLRNNSGEPVNVPALGAPGMPLVIEPGASVDVPDDHPLADLALWDPAVWGVPASLADQMSAADMREEIKRVNATTGSSFSTGGSKDELARTLAKARTAAAAPPPPPAEQPPAEQES